MKNKAIYIEIEMRQEENMQNHKGVHEQAKKTDRKFRQLKHTQKGRINSWLYEAYKKTCLKTEELSQAEEDEQILFRVMNRIEAAGIRISEEEVENYYQGEKNRFAERFIHDMQREYRGELILQVLSPIFSVCKVAGYKDIDLDQPFCFTAGTDEEKSLVCPADAVPKNCLERDDGWRGFRLKGVLAFTYVGILSRILNILAGNNISILAISSFNTDYVFVKEQDLKKALNALKRCGYTIEK